MFWKFWEYSLFENKLLLHKRKNWLLGLFLLLFFSLFFIYHNQSEETSLRVQKKEEVKMLSSIFNQFPKTQLETSEGEEIYRNILEQKSLVNYQVFYLWTEDENEKYIENGLQLNQLRLRVNELGNEGIPDHLIIPDEEILKLDTLMRYIQKHQLPLQLNPLVASNYLVVALNAMSGLLFYIFVLISGSDLLVFENRHRTVVNGFPISFMKKITGKISIHFIYIFTFLVFGMLLGGVITTRRSGMGDFSYPVLVYQNGNFEAISTIRYLLYVLLAMAVITILLLYLSILLNLIFKNAYANVLVGLGIFLLPDLLMTMGLKSNFLHPIKYIDISDVLSGVLANRFGVSQIDYGNSMIWLIVLSIIIVMIIHTKNKLSFSGKK